MAHVSPSPVTKLAYIQAAKTIMLAMAALGVTSTRNIQDEETQ